MKKKKKKKHNHDIGYICFIASKSVVDKMRSGTEEEKAKIAKTLHEVLEKCGEISVGGKKIKIEELPEESLDTTKNAIKVIKALQFVYETEPQPYELPEGVVPNPDPRISFEPFHLKHDKEDKE